MTWRAKIAMLGYICFVISMVVTAGVKIASSNIHNCQPNHSSHLDSTVAIPKTNACEPVDIDLDINEPELFDDMQ